MTAICLPLPVIPVACTHGCALFDSRVALADVDTIINSLAGLRHPCGWSNQPIQLCSQIAAWQGSGFRDVPILGSSVPGPTDLHRSVLSSILNRSQPIQIPSVRTSVMMSIKTGLLNVQMPSAR